MARPLLLSVIFLLLPGSVRAQVVRSFSVAADNDGFVDWVGPGVQADRYYTHGLRFQGVVEWEAPGAGILGGDSLTVCHPGSEQGDCLLTRVILGQAIYTPGYLFDEEPSSQDRPYAGWLYGDLTVGKVDPGGVVSLGLQLGVTGSPSMAGPVHRWFHRALGKAEPRGWDHQIPFEPAFSFRVAGSRAFPMVGEPGGGFLALVPQASAAAGTLRTDISAGLSLQSGWNAPSTLDWLGPTHAGPYFLFQLGFEGEFVLRDLFLDGSMWHDSPDVDRGPGVGRLHARVEAGGHRFGVELAVTRSTREFEYQVADHTFGTIRLIFRG